ncbi:hypothetical protein N7523_001727 [Penicillium sp. IBT 18751x]|nr:hypothetical protein N7523_001727 [Penicillium sp. IBT 18751x]
MSSGTGTVVTTTAGTTTSTKSTTTTASTMSIATTTSVAQPTGAKAVFAHYMVLDHLPLSFYYSNVGQVGSMTSAEAVTDVRDAMNAGFDGFALNTHTISSSDTWNTNALKYLFDAAAGTNFKLFVSFDMSWGLDVTQLAAFLAPYATQNAYYKVNGQAFVSTYAGGTITNSAWQTEFIQPLTSTYGISPYFVPDFDDFPGYPTGIFSSYPVLSGVFSWESAWPSPGTTPANVSDSVDAAALQQAHAAGKTYMMRESFKLHYLWKK